MECVIKYVAIEGIEGSGKTELCKEIEHFVNTEYDTVKTIYIKEPQPEGLGMYIRKAIIEYGRDKIDPMAQLFLFMALRRHNRDICAYRIKEIMEYDKNVKNIIVLLDRFISSTLVYQGIIGGIEQHLIMTLNSMAWDLLPEFTVLLDKYPEETIDRVKNRNEKRDNYAIDYEYLLKAKNAFKLINNKLSGIKMVFTSTDTIVIKNIVDEIIKVG